MRILFTKRVNDCLLAIYYYTILDVSITIFISCIGAVIVEKIVKMLIFARFRITNKQFLFVIGGLSLYSRASTGLRQEAQLLYSTHKESTNYK